LHSGRPCPFGRIIVAVDPAYAEVLARHRQFMREWIVANHDTITASYVIK